MMDLDGSTNIAIPKKNSANTMADHGRRSTSIQGAKVQRPTTLKAGEDNSERQMNKIKKDV